MTDTNGTRTAPPIGVIGMARWFWRQLTSMRTALILLFLLAVASVPGSLIPQRGVDPVQVSTLAKNNPTLAEWYDRLGLFDVFGSVWFGAIYLLLMISLLGCILPRTWQHIAVVRARPPAAPKRLERLPEHRTWTTEASSAEVLQAAKGVLRRYRVVEADGSLAAERGYLREWGNLVFHVAITIVLVGIAVGNLFGFQGSAIVVAGNGFANTVTQYDSYQRGAFFDETRLPPFALTVENFDAEFQLTGEQRGAPRDFDALVSYTSEPGAPEQEYHLRANAPLTIGDSQIHLLGHGYAPRFTVRDGDGEVAFAGPVVFLQQDGNFTSKGVVKAPDAAPTQLGFEGFFLPTATVGAKTGPISLFPDALRPEVFLTAYEGDLGMDTGFSQSVYQLEKSGLRQLRDDDGSPFAFRLAPDERISLPDGAGSITFDGYERWVNLQVSSNPGTGVVLTGAIAGLIGLLLSLVVRRRRVWVRVRDRDGRTEVEVAGLDKADDGGTDLDVEITEIAQRLGFEPEAEPAGDRDHEHGEQRSTAVR